MQECLEYFREAQIWEHLFKEFRKKYYSYGHFAGCVTLKNLSNSEIEVLEGFFGKNYHGKKSISISAELFRKTLENSRYREIMPEKLLEEFFQELLVGKQEEKQNQESKKDKILSRVLKEQEGMPAKKWLMDMKMSGEKSRSQTLAEWEQQLRFGAEIINHLPYRMEKYCYLAVFAASLTGNPHAFDWGTTEGTFLYKLVEWDLKQRNIEIEETNIFPAYKRQKSYLAAGILIDDMSNYALFYQVQALKKNGELHPGMKGFCAEKEMIQVPLAVIATWSELRCVEQEIYIVENPSVFALLCGETMSGSCEKKISCMCMNGQPRLAGIMALDLLAKSGTIIYYAGDLDPEGLLIAQKLAEYYPGEFHFWQMSEECYEKCRSKEQLSEKRIKMLEKITDKKLIPVARRIAECKVAGYQENLYSH